MLTLPPPCSGYLGQELADFLCSVDPYVEQIRREASEDRAPSDDLLLAAGGLITLLKLAHAWSDWRRLQRVIDGADDRDFSAREKRTRLRVQALLRLAAPYIPCSRPACVSPPCVTLP